jgi:4-oxalocrotonate tautomerase
MRRGQGPPGRVLSWATEEDLMPNITIQWYAGRTTEQKRELTRAITDAVVKIGKTTADQVHIVFQDVEKSNWGWNGKLASD